MGASQRRRGRLLLQVCVFLGAFLIGSSITTSAFGQFQQDGRRTDATDVDGTSAYLRGDSFYAASGDCVLYAVLVYDATAGRMVQTGLVRCDGTSIDGTCEGGHRFAERFNGSSYFCNPGGSFDNGDLIYAYIDRNGASSTTMSGAIGSASNSQSGFGLNNNVRAYAWGESTSGGNATCPTGNAQGEFTLWDKYKNTSGWTTVSNASIFHGSDGVSGPCWTIGVQQSDGGFHAW